jgi:hypothetical protein
MTSIVVGWLRQRDGATKLSGGSFIKQDSSDSCPKAEPFIEAFFLYHLEEVTEIGGYSLSHTWSYIISLVILNSRVR